MATKNLSFDINFRIKMCISLEPKLRRDIDDYCDAKKINISNFLEDNFKQFMKEKGNTKDLNNLLRNNQKFKDAQYIIKTEIMEELKIPRQGFAREFSEHLKKRLENEGV